MDRKTDKEDSESKKDRTVPSLTPYRAGNNLRQVQTTLSDRFRGVFCRARYFGAKSRSRLEENKGRGVI